MGVSDESTQKTLAINSTLKPDEKPAYTKVDEAAKKIGNETLAIESEPEVTLDTNSVQMPTVAMPSPSVTPLSQPSGQPAPTAIQERTKTPTVPRPSSGRFMDVVAPSSPVKPQSVVTQPTPVPQQAAVALSAESIPDDHSDSIDTEPTPLTPFLPDAKVEKRPLGAAYQSDELLDPAALAAPVEPEIASQLVAALEEGQIDAGPLPSTSARLDGDQPVLDATDFEGQSAEEMKLQAIESSDAEKLSPAMHESVRMVESSDTEKMIAQTPPQTTNTAGTIFDVNEYHQPLDSVAKQKSGWGVVIVILVIIILAALLGGGAYLALNLGA
jgi:hypothetical protein